MWIGRVEKGWRGRGGAYASTSDDDGDPKEAQDGCDSRQGGRTPLVEVGYPLAGRLDWRAVGTPLKYVLYYSFIIQRERISAEQSLTRLHPCIHSNNKY